MCCNCLLQASESPLDFALEKIVRMQQLVDRILEQFPAAKERDRARTYSYLLPDEMRPIRASLDAVAESYSQVQPQFS